MKTFQVFVVLSLALLATNHALHAQRPGRFTAMSQATVADTPAGRPIDERAWHPGWLVEFQSVPELLRMHVSNLQSHRGLVVSAVLSGSPTDRMYGLKVGDVLLAVGQRKVVDIGSLPEIPEGEISILRAGEVVVVTPRPIAGVQPPVQLPRMPRRIWNAPFRNQGVSASAVATGNESVSVATNGDQVVLEMSLPELESKPIRFQGTRQQIIDQLEQSELSPEARQRVLETIR